MFSHLKLTHLILPSICGLFLLSCSRTPTTAGEQGLKRMTAFVGGTFDASGVAHVPGTDGVLFVDNGRPGEVFWMRLDQNGKQVGAITPINLGIDLEDLEGITTDGTYFYVVSSQSRPKAIAGQGIVRFKFDAGRQRVDGVESIAGLKSFLTENVAELREVSESLGKDGGLNIEGLAWDPRQGRLLLGLRSPVVDGHALLIPLRLRDRRGAFSLDNLEVEGSKAIRLSLEGLGVRAIEYDGRAKIFKLISGAAENQKQTEFVLWDWNGNEQHPVLRQTDRFEQSLKPEGVARATVGSRDFIIIVFDASGYIVLD
jgi:Protein of unknown function (DUF3616)